MNYSQLNTSPANVALISGEFLEFVFDTNSFDADLQLVDTIHDKQSDIIDHEIVEILPLNQIGNFSFQTKDQFSNQQKENCYFEAATIWIDNYLIGMQPHYDYPRKDFHLRHSLTQLLVAIYYHLDSYDCFHQRADFFAQSFQSILNILRESQILESRNYAEALQIPKTLGQPFTIFAEKMIFELGKIDIGGYKLTNQKIKGLAIRQESVISTVNSLDAIY